MEKLVCGLCSVPLGIPLSKRTLSAVNIDHSSVNNCTLPAIKPQDTLFEHQAAGPLLSSDWSMNSVMEVSPWWLAGSQWQQESLSHSGCRNHPATSTALAASSTRTKCCKGRIHHYLLILYVGEEDEMSSRSETRAKHHGYKSKYLQIFTITDGLTQVCQICKF